MTVVVFVGRVLFIAIFLYSSFGHLFRTRRMASYAKSRRVPMPTVATFVGGILLLLGSISILLGVWADLGALFLAAFLIPTSWFMHGFWHERGSDRNREQTQFLKDLALAGAALMIAGLMAIAGRRLGLTITGPLFDIR